MVGEAAALAAALAWAIGSHLFGRIGAGSSVAGAERAPVPAGAMNLGKCLTAASLFAATSLATTGRLWPDMPRVTLLWLLASGFVGLALGDTCYFGSLLAIGVRRALLLLSTAPVFTAIGGAVLLDEPLTQRDAVAITAVLAGVALVVYEAAPAGPPSALAKGSGRAAPPSRATGALLGIGAGIGQAGGSLMSRHAMIGGEGAAIGALDASLVRLAAGLVGLLLLAALSGRLVTWLRALRQPRAMASVAGSAVLGSYVGIWLAQVAIAEASSAAVAATLLATAPLFALPLGRMFGAEPITARALGGTVVACAGVALLTLGTA